MKNATRWIVINRQASSLFDVIADEVFKITTVGKDKWLSLMDGSLSQKTCHTEGFNLRRFGIYGIYVKARIGLLANWNNNCGLSDSCIGFGTWIRSCDGDLTSVSCGTAQAGCGGNPNNVKAAFGYILVQ